MSDPRNDITTRRATAPPNRPPIQWPIRQTPRNNERAINYAREKVSRELLSTSDEPPAHTELEPIKTPPATMSHGKTIQPLDSNQTDSASQSQPQARTMRSEPYDWNKYHSAWQQYYYQYFGNYYGNWVKQQRENIAQQAASQAQANSKSEEDDLSENQKAIKVFRQKIRDEVGQRAKKIQGSSHFKPALAALGVAATVLLLNYNQVIVGAIKQYIAPGSVVTTPVIVEPSSNALIGPEPKIIIPKIGVEVPVVYDEKRTDENSYQKALERGVVHLGPTALPGTLGNAVIGGHSSNNVFNPGNYKYAFVNLNKLDEGDIMYLNYDSVRYTYKVTVARKIISPKDTSVLNPTPNAILTLFTCDPPGTDINRLIVQAEQIDPNPAGQVATPKEAIKTDTKNPLPANSRTLLDRLFNW